MDKSSAKFHFFEGFESPLSTLRFSDFELDGRKFNSAEQCFQFHKAEFFQDPELALKIVAEGVNPMECRRLGDTLDTTQAKPNWPSYARMIMERANVAKFKQNEGLRKYLFMTKDNHHLVYCNPEEQFWSIGLGKANPKVKEVSCWMGPNHLGDILVNIRTALMNDPEYHSELEVIDKTQQVNKRKYLAKVEKAKKVKTSP